MTTRYLICGGRDFADRALMDDALSKLILHPEDAEIIHGDARGADRMAGKWAIMHKVKSVRTFPVTPADWDRYGKGAGAVRNRQMLFIGKPDVVIGFPGGRGTADMLRQAYALKKQRDIYGGPPLIVVEVKAGES